MNHSQKQILSPISHTQVKIDDSFWAARIKTNREVTIPTIYQRYQETGRIAAWELAWKPGMPHEPHIFWDSDVAKWLEAAAHSLAHHPDQTLEKQLDSLIHRIARAQQPDGYVNTHFTVVRPEMRWANLRDGHELYCAGHLIEAAVAYYQATGKKKFLQIVCRYADYIDSVFGSEPGKKRGYPGHEEIELALVKLYHTTGHDRYLKLARYFIDERGRQPHYFDQEARTRGEATNNYWAKTHEYTQSHLPVREQRRPVGHAVRGTYLYCAMADLAAEFNDHELLGACQRIWQHLVGRRMYITGGIGTSKKNEGYTEDYDLPNESAYAETCAAIGLIFWAHRMLRLDPDAKYADVLERALYNGMLSGVSLAGDTFFYENPLESQGNHHRWQWHSCSCCPPNMARLLASLGQYIYAENENEIYIHLYIGSQVELQVSGQTMMLRQTTHYPWDGKIRISLHFAQPVEFTLAMRLPGWCQSPEIKMNGEGLPPGLLMISHGYAKIHRLWHSGDQVDLDLPLVVERIQAHPEVKANCGRVALQRGPLVYCIEETDNGANLNDLALLKEAKLEARYEKTLLGGVVAIYESALRRKLTPWQGKLYSAEPALTEKVRIKAIPYFAWDNRDPGEMLVWIRNG